MYVCMYVHPNVQTYYENFEISTNPNLNRFFNFSKINLFSVLKQKRAYEGQSKKWFLNRMRRESEWNWRIFLTFGRDVFKAIATPPTFHPLRGSFKIMSDVKTSFFTWTGFRLFRQGCQMFLNTMYQNGDNKTSGHKIHQKCYKINQMPQSIPIVP
jgi:hypothetical protein